MDIFYVWDIGSYIILNTYIYIFVVTYKIKLKHNLYHFESRTVNVRKLGYTFKNATKTWP